MRIAVTGATGFVGKHLMAHLRERGHEPVALTRSQSSQAEQSLRRVSSYSSRTELGPALADVDAIVHLAARVHVMRETASDPLEKFRAANVRSAEALRDVALRSGARLVLLSSIKVHGEGSADVIDETAPYAPADPYAQSKVEAELVLRNAPSDLRWSIIRPPLVYGPDVGGNFRRLLSLASLSRSVPLPLGGISNLRSLVYVGNLCDLIRTACENPAFEGQSVIAADGRDVSTTELLRILAGALGGKAQLISVPPALLGLFVRLAGRGAEWSRLSESYRVRSSLLGTTLPWVPPHSVEQGLTSTALWWKQR